MGFGVASSAGERGTARGSQTSRTGFVWAAEATSLVAAAGATARSAEASVTHEFVCDSLNAGDEAATIMPRPVVVRSARL